MEADSVCRISELIPSTGDGAVLALVLLSSLRDSTGASFKGGPTKSPMTLQESGNRAALPSSKQVAIHLVHTAVPPTHLLLAFCPLDSEGEPTGFFL